MTTFVTQSSASCCGCGETIPAKSHVMVTLEGAFHTTCFPASANSNKSSEVGSPSSNLSAPISAQHTAFEDTEERYRKHLAYLISRTKSRGGTRYFNQFIRRCRYQAAAAYPKGAAAARKKDASVGGFLAGLAAIFEIFG